MWQCTALLGLGLLWLGLLGVAFGTGSWLTVMDVMGATAAIGSALTRRKSDELHSVTLGLGLYLASLWFIAGKVRAPSWLVAWTMVFAVAFTIASASPFRRRGGAA